MIAEGNFIFKGIRKKDGGEFVNTQGQKIKYDASYEVKFDEVTEDNECFERKVKVSLENKELIEKLLNAKIYSKIHLIFEVGFNTRGITLKLIDAQSLNKKNKEESESEN